MSTVSDLGEQFETPDEALIDAEKTIRELKEEQNRLRLRLSESQVHRDHLAGQIHDADLRLKKFKEAVALVVKELVHD